MSSSLVAGHGASSRYDANSKVQNISWVFDYQESGFKLLQRKPGPSNFSQM